MNDNEWVPSPCVGECRISDGICTGCGRTTQEIINWLNFTEKEKKKIMDRLKYFECKNNVSDKLK